MGGVRVNILSHDISRGTWDKKISGLFQPGEQIKVAVVPSFEDRGGEFKLSIYALERREGQLFENKKAVFENAEKTAYEFVKREQKAVERETVFVDWLA